MRVIDRYLDVGLKLHIREWSGKGVPFVLVHGLASNARTWDLVGDRLAKAGHHVIALDQRGHGLSDKPDEGYDFATVTADLARVIDRLQLSQPILVGQSWGGNVMLEFGARYPDIARGLAFIDGGFLDLQSRPDATWEKVSVDLKPPHLIGIPREKLKERIRGMHPDWTEIGIESVLHNFETLPDGTIQPWLTLDRHMLILRAMWEQSPRSLYPQVTTPVLICVAESNGNPDWAEIRAKQVTAAEDNLPNVSVQRFENTDHDIHIQRPETLTNLFLETLNQGIWSK